MQGGSKIMVGTVVSIDDPDKLGRSQVRVHGIHDDTNNIPDSDLMWCFPMKSSSDPSLNKIGSGGNGLLVGSKILMHMWDESGQQSGFIIGSVPKSGDAKSGSSTNGSPTVDTTKSSTPTASRGNDINPVVDNPIKDAKTTPGSNDDQGKNIYNDVAKSKAKHAKKPTIGATKTPSGKDVIALISKIDPSNIAGSLPAAVSSMKQLLNMNNMSSPAGINSIVGMITGQALGNLSKIIGSSNVSAILGTILSSSNSSNMNNGSYQFTSDSNILTIVQTALYQYGLSLEGADELLLSTDDSSDALISALLTTLSDQLSQYYSNGTLTKEVLIQLIEQLLAQVTQQGTQNALGGSGLDLNSLMTLIPAIAPLIQNTLNSHLPQSVLDTNKIQQTLQNFAKSHALLNTKENIIKQIFSGANSQLNSQLSNLSSLSGLINPGTGTKINGG